MIDEETLMNSRLLQEVVPPELVVTDSAILAGFSVDDIAPKAIVYPTSLNQAAEVIKLANAEKWSVIPWGGGTKMGLGNIPRQVDLVLNTGRLDKIIDIDSIHEINIYTAIDIPLIEKAFNLIITCWKISSGYTAETTKRG